MRLSDVLTLARVRTGLSTTDKEATLRALASLLAGAEQAPGEEALLSALRERERLSTTGVGGGVAIPHARLEMGDTRMALAISSEGVPFETVDGAPVHVLAAIVGPRETAALQLRLLARAARVLRDQSVRARLCGAATERDVLEVFAQEEARH